jgi:hypothetical protein
MHLVLFCICTYFLIRKRSRAGVIILLAAAIMLALATADVALTFRVIVNDLPTTLRQFELTNTLLTHIRLKTILFVTDKQVCPFELHQYRI